MIGDCVPRIFIIVKYLIFISCFSQNILYAINITICFLQIEAEKTKVVVMQQEAEISKIKEENKEIRDEVEADLSMFYACKA